MSGGNDQCAGVRLVVAHRLAGVHQQVQQHLLQLDAIAVNRRQPAREALDHGDMLLEELATHQNQHLGEQRGDVERLKRASTPASTSCADRRITSPALMSSATMSLTISRSSATSGRLLPQQTLGRLRVTEDGRHRLIQLVRERAGELAQDRYARQVRHLLASLLRLGFGGFELGDVAADSL